ncbi:hypothetical protein C1645_808979 [Glomus cerebriforme]|uniref:BTB/POZ domain-containing protein n=1 Tax=Glomus cerebriforme TaxID=658196 RepID=A0A397SN03_9GLOM|nr:hypothetical protein C1645_808979 [Glomus cerebriforme]
MSYKHEFGVIIALEKLLETEANYDVIIHVGKEPNIKEFHTHSNILSCSSKYFNKILFGENIQKQNGKYVINKPNFTPQAYELIIKYIYTGYINIRNKTEIELLEITIASDELKLVELTKIIKDSIIEDLHKSLKYCDTVEILQMVYYHKSLTDLQEFCLEIICFEPRILFKFNKFIKLPASLLEVILKRDDLNLFEVEVWESLIKWGLAREQGLKRDTSKWNQEDINAFKRILYKFIPLIRFHEMSSEDYINKVKPYEEILSQELRDDILKSHMISGYIPTLNIYTPRCTKYNVDSTIVNQEHIALFANWIERKEKHLKYFKAVPYEFNLLYRASRDGKRASNEFHKKCDNKGSTIIILKVENSEQIVGRYDDKFRSDSSKSIYNDDSFIFSFTSKDNLQSAQIGYNKNKNISIYDGYDDKYSKHHECDIDKRKSLTRHGLLKLSLLPFVSSKVISENISGNNSDLRLSYFGSWYNCISDYSSYPKIDIPNVLKVEDYEVFQIIEKPLKVPK